MTRPTYEDLLDEVLVLRQLVTEMTAVDELLPVSVRLGLTNRETACVMALFKNRTCTKQAIHAYLYPLDETGGPAIKIVDVFICKIRRKLKEQGIAGTIDTVWGQGYRMSDALRAMVAAIVTPAPEALAA